MPRMIPVIGCNFASGDKRLIPFKGGLDDCRFSGLYVRKWDNSLYRTGDPAFALKT